MMPVPQSNSGAEYVRQITRFESDRLIRSAFQNLVLRIVPPAVKQWVTHDSLP